MSASPVVRTALIAVALATLPIMTVVTAGTVVIASSAGSTGAPGDLGALKGPAVPLEWQLAELDAAGACPGLPWSTLGALGFLASGSGRWEGRDPPWWGWPGGLFGIDTTPAGALSTVVTTAAGPATSTLCAALRSTGSIQGALIALTGSPKATLEIETLATSLADTSTLSAGRAEVVVFAAGALGLPYQWGGNGPLSYDCSGLVVAAYRAAGAAVPRTAQEQFDASIRVLGTPAPGDLIFFGATPSSVEHVGIEIGSGLMIDAPYTGAFVRIDHDGSATAVGVGRVG